MDIVDNPVMSDWRAAGIEDDIRPRMFELAKCHRPFALATIAVAEGGPRPVGSQMLITEHESWGFLSGGCIESDVERQSREVLRDGRPRQLVYGKDSPFVDIRLPCGGRLEVLIERIAPNDAALRELERLTSSRRAAVWRSDGMARSCIAAGRDRQLGNSPVNVLFSPNQRLMVVGTDPTALAIARLGSTMAWETTLLVPFGTDASPPFGIASDRRPLHQSLAADRLDRWTAVAVATHDLDADEAALALALRSETSFVGVLGSRRKMHERMRRLAALGLTNSQLERLHSPIGLEIGAKSPAEIAVSVIGQIIHTRAQEAAAVEGIFDAKARDAA